MGNTVGTPIVSEYLEDEVGPIVCQNSLGNASRFLKTVKAYHEEEGYVVVKIYKKRYPRENLGEKYLKALNEIKESFHVTNTTYNFYNIMPYQSFLETDRSGYLIRQYFHNNLYDRISTRPFLSMIEKKFFTFQLLHALDQCFFRGILHGDIKCENIMVTTTNWLYLTDFACYKPTFIPEDNPSDFSFYFDTSGRRTCYIAPERFYDSNKGAPQGELNIKMDIFSLGCVIAEIFLEGVAIFDFSQLLSYRKGEYSPEPMIRRIPDPHIQSLILHMIQKEPDNRFSPVKYLENWKNKAFPTYFDFAHQFISEVMKLDNDDRILCLSDKFDEIIQVFTTNSSNFNSPNLTSSNTSSPTLNSNFLKKSISTPNSPHISNNNSNNNNNNNNNLSQSQPIHQHHFQKSNSQQLNTNISNIILNTENYIKDQEKFDNIDLNNFNLEQLNINVNNKKEEEIQLQQQRTATTNQVQQQPISTATLSQSNTNTTSIIEGLDIFLPLIYSALKYCKYPQTKVKCVGSLFERFAQYLDDEVRLQKIVPYLISMIMSSSSSGQMTVNSSSVSTVSASVNFSNSRTSSQPSLVRVEALRTLAKVLEMVQNFPPSESQIFSLYILPSLSQLSSDQTEEIVRIAYAEILPQLATTAKRYLEIAQRYRDPDQRKADFVRSQKAKGYDAELNEIQDLFLTKVSDLLTKDSCLTLKRIILSDIYRLCVFFGRQKTNESVLPLIITFLNDKDWQLRCAFFENIVAVCTVVGAGSLESFIYPCILLALADEEEFVTEKALASLTELCSLGLLRKNILLELLIKTSPMLLHPSNWIRYAVISLIIKICSTLSRADLHCYAKPKLSMYLQGEISDNINENTLFHLLESPISRDSFTKIIKLIYKNQITLQSALHSSNQNDDHLASSTSSANSTLLNLGTGGSYRRLRALSQKLYPVNGSFGSVGSSGTINNMSLSKMDEQQQEFLSQMNELKIPSEDQEKIFKCLDYLLLKKYKDDELLQAQYNQIPSVSVTGNNVIVRQSIAKSSNINYINNYNSSQQLQQNYSNLDITRLPNVPIRVCKMRSMDPNLLTSSNNLTPTTMSSSTTSLPSINLNQLNLNASSSNSNNNNTTNSNINSNTNAPISNQPTQSNLSLSSPTMSNVSNMNLSTISTNSLPANLNTNNNINNSNSNSNTNLTSNTNNQSSNNINNDTNVNQSELNIVTKKFKILSKEKLQLNDILKVETTTDCFIYTSPPIPDLGIVDQSIGLSSLNNNLTSQSNNMNSNSINSNNLSNSSNSQISNLNSGNNSNNINNNNLSNLNSGNGINSNNLNNINTTSNTTTSLLYNESSQLPQWRPQGILVGHFFEHKAAVNQIQVSSDNLFFATASNDGYVKIWDCQRMEKSVTNKSRQTYNQDGGRIISIAICEKTHSIASASDRGSIHVFKVGIGGKQKSGNLKYTGFSTVKQIQENEGNIVAVDHYSTNSASIVTYATSRGGIKGWDLRCQQQAFTLASEPSLGLIQALLVDPNRNWFITATSRGFITCWDLRFKIPIYNHRVTNGRIFKMVPYLGGLRSAIETSWIYISTEMDNVILFDLASKNIRRTFKRSFSDSNSNSPNNQINTSSSNLSFSSTPTSMSSSFISGNNNNNISINSVEGSIQLVNSENMNNNNNNNMNSPYDLGTESMRPIPKTNILPSPNIHTLNIPSVSATPMSMINQPINTTVEKKMPTIRAMLSPVNCTYLITAGDDKRIKYWEGKDVSSSYYISNGKEPPPPFNHKYSNDTSMGLETLEEVWCDTSQSSFYSNSIQSTSSLQQRQKQKSPVSTPTVHHQEPILDLKVMEVPNPMLISASTDGIVKVWK